MSFALLFLAFASNAFAFGGHRTPALPPVEDSWNRYYPAQPTPRPSPTAPAHGAVTLRVLSYNIKGLPLPTLDHTRYRDIGRILAERRRAGNAPHVVALQEAFVSTTSQLIEAAGYPYVSRGPQGYDLRYNAGLLILSEFPMDEASFHVFERCASYDCLTNKGVQHVRLRVPGLPTALDFFNTHMNADVEADFWTPSEEAEQVRLEQVQEMRDYFFEKNQASRPLLAVGDFNFRPGEYAYESLLAFTGLTDAAKACSQRGVAACIPATNLDDPERDWRNTLDRNFYRDGSARGPNFEVARFAKRFRDKVRGRDLSDHHGVEFEYRLRW